MLHRVGGLTTRFAILGGLMIVIATIALSTWQHHAMRRDIRTITERQNVTLAQSLSHFIWVRHGAFLRRADALDNTALRAAPEIDALRRDLIANTRGSSILKVKIYSRAGRTIFSTEPDELGDDQSNNPGVLRALDGGVKSDLKHRDTLNAFENVIYDRDVLETYVALRSRDGRIEAIIELYYDATPTTLQLEASLKGGVVFTATSLFLLYLLLLGVVWYSEKRMARHIDENARLARSAEIAREASRLKSEFLANMSHELRTPLNAVIGFSEALKTQMFGPVGAPRYLEYATDIWNSARRLLAIIDDMLAMSRVQDEGGSINQRWIDLAAIADGCACILDLEATERGVTLAASYGAQLPFLLGDEHRLQRLILSLGSNAIKFTPEGGHVDITVAEQPDGALCLSVADTGIGVAPEDIPTILAPFGRLSSPYDGSIQGAGLGLPLAKAYALAHDATFEFLSEPGEGTKVRVVFPPERCRPVSGGPPEVAEQKRAAGRLSA